MNLPNSGAEYAFKPSCMFSNAILCINRACTVDVPQCLKKKHKIGARVNVLRDPSVDQQRVLLVKWKTLLETLRRYTSVCVD